MARKRDIDPSFWSNEQLGMVPRDARLLFAGLISFADDEGRLKASAGYLRATMFPYDTDLSAGEVAGWLSSLTLAGLVCTYDTERGVAVHLPSWHAWQAINRRFDSKIPPCPKHGPCPQHESPTDPSGGDDHSRTCHVQVSDMSVIDQQQIIDQWLASDEPFTDHSSTTGAGTGAGPDRTDSSRSESRQISESSPVDESVQPTRRTRRSGVGPLVVPDSVAAFHASLSELAGYAPTQAFLDKVAEKYGHLDLVEEAVKIKGWLRVNPGKRRDVAGFTLNWLKKAVSQPQRRYTNGRPTPIRPNMPHQQPPETDEQRKRREAQDAEALARADAIDAIMARDGVGMAEAYDRWLAEQSARAVS